MNRLKDEAFLSFDIRLATPSDLSSMVELSLQKRLHYEKSQTRFWKKTEGSEEKQKLWFAELLKREDHILLIAEAESQPVGFIIGALRKAPEVYDPGGLTLVIDDFCVTLPSCWDSIGSALLIELEKRGKEKGAVQMIVVCGAHDSDKSLFLEKRGCTVYSHWYGKEIG